MPFENLENFNKYYAIQIWSDRDPLAESLESLAMKVGKDIIFKNKAKVVGMEGPTPLLPDFFSELYGKYRGYLIWVERNVNPYELKKTCIELEKNLLGKRMCDIDVYISKDESIHRENL